MPTGGRKTTEQKDNRTEREPRNLPPRKNRKWAKDLTYPCQSRSKRLCAPVAAFSKDFFMSADRGPRHFVAIHDAVQATSGRQRAPLSKEDRLVVAAELYRLADRISAPPITHSDAVARQQAIRRVKSLRKMLRAADVLPEAWHKPKANDDAAP